MELLLPAQNMSVLGKPLSLPPQSAQDTCAQSVLPRECPVPEVSPSVVLLPPMTAPEQDAPGAVAPSSSGDLAKY